MKHKIYTKQNKTKQKQVHPRGAGRAASAQCTVSRAGRASRCELRRRRRGRWHCCSAAVCLSSRPIHARVRQARASTIGSPLSRWRVCVLCVVCVYCIVPPPLYHPLTPSFTPIPITTLTARLGEWQLSQKEGYAPQTPPSTPLGSGGVAHLQTPGTGVRIAGKNTPGMTPEHGSSGSSSGGGGVVTPGSADRAPSPAHLAASCREAAAALSAAVSLTLNPNLRRVLVSVEATLGLARATETLTVALLHTQDQPSQITHDALSAGTCVLFQTDLNSHSFHSLTTFHPSSLAPSL